MASNWIFNPPPDNETIFQLDTERCRCANCTCPVNLMHQNMNGCWEGICICMHDKNVQYEKNQCHRSSSGKDPQDKKRLGNNVCFYICERIFKILFCSKREASLWDSSKVLALCLTCRSQSTLQPHEGISVPHTLQ